MNEQIYIDGLFSLTAHRLMNKDEVINDLVYTIAKKIDQEKSNKKVFTYRVDSANKRLRYIQLKSFKALKKLYGIKGYKVPGDRDKIYLKREC